MIQLHHLMQAMQDFNHSNVGFNNGNIFCFLYLNKRYPLTALINHSSNLAGENANYNRDGSLIKLCELLDYVKVKQVLIKSLNLVTLQTEEKLAEIGILSEMTKRITNQN